MKISRKLKIATIAVIWIPCLIGLLLWGQASGAGSYPLEFL